MGHVKRQVYNTQLMEATDYERGGCIKSLIKNLLWLERMSERGDTVASSVLIDMKNALGFYGGQLIEVLTPKQKQVIEAVLMEDVPQKDIAFEMEISQQGVSFLLNGGIKRMQKYLKTGKVPWRQVTEEERQYVLDHYGKKSTREISQELRRSENNIRVIYHNLTKGGGGDEQEGQD